MGFSRGGGVVTNGLVLYLDSSNRKSYDGTSIWKDISGNENNCTLSNSPIIQSFNKNTLYFNGTNQSGEITNNSTLQIVNNQTLEFWIYPTERGVRRNFYNKAYGGEGTITYEPNGRLNYYYGTAGANTTPYQGFSTSGSPLSTLNRWYHVVLVRNLSMQAATLYWYINGELNRSNLASYSQAVASSQSITIGDGYTNYFKGNIAIVKQYNVALTSDQVLQNYNKTKGRFLL